MWPTALATLGIDLKGKIAAPAEEGRAVARLTDLGHGQALRALFRPDTPDGPVPVPLVQAVLTLLDDWRPEVDAIVVVESLTRPTLTEDLAHGLSRRLQVPVVGRWAIVDPDVAPGQGAVNSAQRVAAVGRRASPAGRRPRPARGCCWSTTWSSPAGRSRSPRARSAPPARPPCCRSRWPPSPEGARQPLTTVLVGRCRPNPQASRACTAVTRTGSPGSTCGLNRATT